MNNIRIGKDFRVLWRIFEEDDGVRLPRILEGKSLTLILASPFKKQEITDFAVRENVIEWTFYGKDQKSATSYSLVLIENKDEIGMVTVDKTDAFNLVTRSSMEEIEDNPNLVIETVELESDVTIAPTVEYVPIQIDADTELSETSTNAVENRVITAALKEKQNVITDLESIRSGAGKGATAVQHNELATVAKTGSYSDLKNTPVIPAAVTESTVAGWGFTKDKGQVVVDTVEQLEQLDLPKGYLVGVRSTTDAYILGNTWQRLMKDGEMPEIDLSALATKEEVIENEEITAAALNDLDKRVKEAATKESVASILLSLQDYSKKTEVAESIAALSSEVNATIESLTTEIVANEEVTAAALNDLNDRKASKEDVANAIAEAITNTLNTAV